MPANSFPPSHRLCCSEEFDAVFKNRDHAVSNKSFMFLAKDNGRGFNRLGLVISKKNVQHAVDRNRIKRHIRETFRQLQAPDRGMDVIVLARAGVRQDEQIPGTIDALFRELSAKMERA